MNILAILAHHDDEALLCGGTLLRLRALGHRVVVCIATAVACENPLDDPVQEKLRRERRLMAYYAVLADLDAFNFELCFPQEFIFRAQWLVMADLVITHGDDTGHPTHETVFQSVCGDIPVHRVPIVRTAREGPISVPIDLAAKRRLLEFYRYGTTRTSEWNPFANPDYAWWCGDREHFTADPSVVEWWRAQFPGLASDCGLCRQPVPGHDSDS